MDFFSGTTKTFTSRVFCLCTVILMAGLLWVMVNANISCVDQDGCIKSWCEIDWLPSDVRDHVRKCY